MNRLVVGSTPYSILCISGQCSGGHVRSTIGDDGDDGTHTEPPGTRHDQGRITVPGRGDISGTSLAVAVLGASWLVLDPLGFQFAQQMGSRLMKLAAVLGGRFVPCRTAFESSYSRTIFTIGQAGGDDALTPNREEGQERKTRGKMEMGDG